MLLLYVLGRSVPTKAPETPTRVPAGQTAQAQSEPELDPMDMVKADLQSMSIYWASHSARSIPNKNWTIGGYYDLDYPGHVALAKGRPRLGDADVDLSCTGGSRQQKGDDPACYGKRVKTFERNGRKLCVSPDETPPADVRGTPLAKGYNGSVGWNGWGQCHMTFARGFLGKKIPIDKAVDAANEAAEWMQVFLDGGRPSASELARNRELLAPARSYAADNGGRP